MRRSVQSLDALLRVAHRRARGCRSYSSQADPSGAAGTVPQNARLRFAPSPTGFLHLGGLRTALFNHLLARKWGGKWILRIEDTDQKRLVESSVDNLRSTLEWAGLDYDEGVGVGGSKGPYVQSERLDLYRDYAQRLIDNDLAYECFCSEATSHAIRLEMAQKGHMHAAYDGRCRHLTVEDKARRKRMGHKHIVRFKAGNDARRIPPDLIYGDIQPPKATIPDDFVLLKSDRFPTYHLASVVDDHLMDISHVLRGEEWLPSVPKHHALYHALGWSPPRFAHLPLLVNADGTKLSKRTGDVAVEKYRDKGYEPEALLNFLALMGWDHHSALEELVRETLVSPPSENAGSIATEASASRASITGIDAAGPTEAERLPVDPVLPPQTRSDSHSYYDIFTVPQLISAFSLGHVNHKKAAVNMSKLDFINKMTLRRKAGRLGVDGVMITRGKESLGTAPQTNVDATTVESDTTDESLQEERNDLVKRVQGYLRDQKVLRGNPLVEDAAYVEKVMDAELPRSVLLRDIGWSSIFFFLDPDYTHTEASTMIQTIDPLMYVDLVEAAKSELQSLLGENGGVMTEDLGWQGINAILRGKDRPTNKGKLMKPMRHALTGRLEGPSIATIMAVLGAERSMARLEAGLAHVRKSIRKAT